MLTMGPIIDLRQQPSLQQRITQMLTTNLMLMPQHQLEMFIESQLETNIFLEARRPQQESPTSAQERPPSATPVMESLEALREREPDRLDPESMRQYLEYYESRSSLSFERELREDAFTLEGRLAKCEDWREELLQDIRLERLKTQEMHAAEFLIGCLDDDGYLHDSLEDVATMLAVPESAVARALTVIQAVAWPGVGARSFQERVLLRVQALDPPQELAERLIREGFDDLRAGRLDSLQANLKLSDEALLEALKVIRGLGERMPFTEDPRQTEPALPDGRIYFDGKQWQIEVREPRLPELRLNDKVRLPEDLNSLANETRKAYFLAAGLVKHGRFVATLRRRTLKNLLRLVVTRQEAFLEKGPSYLKPLMQEEAAGELGVHSSTISRAIQHKFVETPHGVLPLKVFFPGGRASGSSELTRDQALSRLEALVASEDPAHPLSDDALADELGRQGLHVARRTVSKYRDELSIPTASARRSIKRLRLGKDRVR